MDLVSNTTMRFFTTDNSAFHIPSDVFANTYFLQYASITLIFKCTLLTTHCFQRSHFVLF